MWEYRNVDGRASRIVRGRFEYGAREKLFINKTRKVPLVFRRSLHLLARALWCVNPIEAIECQVSDVPMTAHAEAIRVGTVDALLDVIRNEFQGF
jgi:hypothetical protein